MKAGPWSDDRLAPNGRKIMENFADWFAGSVAVGTDGKPLQLYHGTDVPEDFSSFKPGTGFGCWFMNDPKCAEMFANWGGGRIIPVFLNLKNPLVAKVTDKVGPSLLATRAKKAGYDGMILTSDDYLPGSVAYVVFNPAQIKSAIGNSGLYLKGSACLTDTQAALDLELAQRAKSSVKQARKVSP